MLGSGLGMNAWTGLWSPVAAWGEARLVDAPEVPVAVWVAEDRVVAAPEVPVEGEDQTGSEEVLGDAGEGLVADDEDHAVRKGPGVAQAGSDEEAPDFCYLEVNFVDLQGFLDEKSRGEVADAAGAPDDLVSGLPS